MGYLLKEALKTLCGVNQWDYAIFWKIGCQNPKLLIWEECYYEPIIYSNNGNGVQVTYRIDLLVTKMMKDNYVNLLGEGLVGRVAFTRNYQWIIRDNKLLGVNPPEVTNEVYTQFSAGIQTIAVIPVHPHGVVQVGSSLIIMENMGFVNDVNSLISQLGCVPGVLLSENYMKNEDTMNNGISVSAHTSGKQPGPNNGQQIALGSFLTNYDPLRSMEQYILSDAFLGDNIGGTMVTQNRQESNNIVSNLHQHCFPDAHFPCTHVDTQVKLTLNKEKKLEDELFTMSSEESCLKPQPPSSDDLFDLVGMDLKNSLHARIESNNSMVMESFPVYSSTASDHLLDAVVSKIHSSSKQIADDNSSSIWANFMQKELIKNNAAETTCFSYKSGISKEDGETSSIISSQISSWADQRFNMKKDTGFASGKIEDISKSNRKRLKPGENPRPRPKDRQMIQDRVKELREIVPNSAKCSIDALLERTIKHMLFLQSVTKHADKLKQTGESKNMSKDGGVLLRDNFEGGATWAYEVGSQSMVCPIIVEDLNSPRQMLVEMLCKERGSFLEIADGIKGLGLTILKGVMEARNDKIWAHFTVEANRNVTRMEIFISLVSILDQAAKNGVECSGKCISVTNPVSAGKSSIQ